MKARKTTLKPDPHKKAPTATTTAGEWLKKEKRRLENLQLAGDAHKVSREHAAFIKALDEILDQHDKLIKYARIVVRCHENVNFEENVSAIETYLVEELGIEP